jgi:hypothetical protein
MKPGAILRTIPFLGATATLVARSRHWGVEGALAVATVVAAVVLLGRLAAGRPSGISSPPALAEAIIGVGALFLGTGVLIGNGAGGMLVVLVGVGIIAAFIVFGLRKGRQARRDPQ